MKRGIVFYIAGESINYLIPVALYSLRKHYDGPICFIVDPDFSPEVQKQINSVPDCFCIEDKMEHGYNRLHRIDLWCRKAWHHVGQYPFDTNLYYDLDHVWLDKFDHSIFDLIEKHGLVCTSANKSPRQGGIKKVRAENCVGEKLPFLHGINGGCAGAVKGSIQAQAWADLIKKTRVAPFLKRNPEEFAMGILKAQGIAGTASYKWSTPISPTLLRNKNYMKNLAPHLALHCVKGTFIKSSAWCQTFREAYRVNFMQVRRHRGLYGLSRELLKRIKQGATNGV